MILIVLLLWMFAFVAGLSASVVRAVTMFSFIAIGQSIKQKKVIEFSLISSMFLLLLVKPMFLFDVGFQLSYLAVFGIVWAQPKLYNLWRPTNFIFDKFWSLMTVSSAAQLGVLPLSLFYFHQFPGLFFLSNLFIIPVLGTILVGGIFVILLAVFNILPAFLARFYNGIIEFMNAFIHWVSGQESFLWQDISMSFLGMLVSYLFIISLFQVSFQFSYKKLLQVLVAILIFQSVLFVEEYSASTKKEFIVFHKSRQSIQGSRIGKILLMKKNSDSLVITDRYAVKNYTIGEEIKRTRTEVFPSCFKLGNQEFLIVGELGVYAINGLKDPIIILQNSPKINLTRLIKTIHPIKIIADGSNYKTYVKRWKISCLENEIPFHTTSEKGAFIYKY
jgi:competence protein ComEC